MTSLRLKNYGHSDAEDIVLTAKFKKPLREISIDDRSLAFENISGGKGQPYVCGKISRLVPGQEIFILQLITLQLNCQRASFPDLLSKVAKVKLGIQFGARYFLWHWLRYCILCLVYLVTDISIGGFRSITRESVR